MRFRSYSLPCLSILFVIASFNIATAKEADVSAPKKKDWLIQLKKSEISARFKGAELIRGLVEPEKKKTAKSEGDEKKAEMDQPDDMKKPGDSDKDGEKKPDEMKPGEKKPDEMKPDEMKPGEMKPGEQKPGVAPVPEPEYKDWPEPQEVGPFELNLDLSRFRDDNLLMVVEFTKPADNKNIPLLVGVGKSKDKKFKKLEVMEVEVQSNAGRFGGNNAGRRRRGGGRGGFGGMNRFPKPVEARIELPRKKFNWVQLKFGKSEASPRIKQLRIFRLDKSGKNDYWLFIGSAMMARGANLSSLSQGIKDRFKDHSPYLVNLSNFSMSAAQLKVDLPKILREHKHARYVVMHVGGVDISRQRPFPKGSEKLRSDLQVILKTVRKAKKIPILSRISYRAYTAQGNMGAVPPEENGSGPYNKKIVDPLIAKYCKGFVDKGLKLGYFDLYTPYQANRNLLDRDGVTFSAEGYFMMREILLRRVFSTAYKGSPEPLPKPGEMGGGDEEGDGDSGQPRTP